MSSNEPANTEQEPRSEAWKTALTVLQTAKPPYVPEGAEVMTVLIEFPRATRAHLRTGIRGRHSATCWRGRCFSSSKVSRSV